VTDGRFSGTNSGCFVGHVSPEAAAGGPIAIVENGDRISINMDRGILHLHLTDKEIQQRLNNWKRPEQKNSAGYLGLYARLASSAHEGLCLNSKNNLAANKLTYLSWNLPDG